MSDTSDRLEEVKRELDQHNEEMGLFAKEPLNRPGRLHVIEIR